MKAPFRFEDPASCAAVREVFRRAGYDQRALVETLGPVRLPSGRSRDLSYFLHLTSGGRALDHLMRLFLLEQAVDRKAVADGLGQDAVELLLWGGLLAPEGAELRATVRMLPVRGGLLLASDPPDCDENMKDQVIGLTGSAAAVADFAVRKPAARTLDLGTGGGLLAFLAASHSREVYGVDLSERSIEFARFNAALNGIDNVRFLCGDLFEPVQGMQFDLIVCNPPFVVSPTRRYLYRDSGERGDFFCRRIVREAPEYLVEGGLMQMACNWVHVAGEDWQNALAAWFEGTGCDAWVLQTAQEGAAAYARVWVQDTEYGDEENAAQLFEDWIAYFEREKIEAISTGLLALRRRTAAHNWVRIEEAPENTSGQAGDSVILGFALRDYLDDATDEILLEERLQASPNIRLEQSSVRTDQGWSVVAAQIRLGQGLQYTGNIDPRVAGLVLRSDGRHTLRELIRQLGESVGVAPESIEASTLGLVRNLVQRGFLLPAAFAG